MVRKSPSNYLLDTTILVDCARGNSQALEFINQLIVPTISQITEAELIQGVKNKSELKLLEKSLIMFKLLPINETVMQRTLSLLKKYSLSSGLLILDAIIAATAIEFNLVLITANYKHFKNIKELNVEQWLNK